MCLGRRGLGMGQSCRLLFGVSLLFIFLGLCGCGGRRDLGRRELSDGDAVKAQADACLIMCGIGCIVQSVRDSCRHHSSVNSIRSMEFITRFYAICRIHRSMGNEPASEQSTSPCRVWLFVLLCARCRSTLKGEGEGQRMRASVYVHVHDSAFRSVLQSIADLLHCWHA
jgi:hypothetical protein